jgi:Flp pilus assembly protein TadG
MRLKNLNHRPSRKQKQLGQALVESALVIFPLLLTLIAVLDFGQVLYTRQLLVERTRSAVRWGMINAWDGTGNGIANMIMYNQPTVKQSRTLLGLTRSNITVTYSPPTAADPNDQRLKVAIVGYHYRLLTPFIAGTFVNNCAVVESTPILYRN